MPAPAARILVVDDEPDLRTLYELTLLRDGHRVSTAGTLQEARALLAAQRFDVLITDMRLPDGLGMALLHELHQQQRQERSIVITAYGSAENAVEALRYGAFDYLTKPVDLKQFRSIVASATQGLPQPKIPPPQDVATTASLPTAAASTALARLAGTSSAMQQLRQRIQKVAPSMAPVLITGESGTGKELAARALHACSHRSSGPWVAVNCGAIPEHLLEAEFFGARKGAFTGATADRQGFFQAANGGTLFLDELGELPLAMQAKLLRAIQERSVRALGATQEESVDVRIISATHRNLASDVQAGRFRQDLFYRLNVIDVHLPALRERREDLPLLCARLLAGMAEESGLPAQTASPALLEHLHTLPLPGNVRELENLLHRYLALGDEGLASPAASAPPAPGPAALPEPTAPRPADLPHDLQSWLDAQERRILVAALQAHGFNRTAAAASLGLNLRQIRYRIERLNICIAPEVQLHDDTLQP
ncbi:MAG: sigma-54 dependent transcriptional regulator [Comamonas sp.]|nr:sigma-54 dependent transcriptional regulator [Comamonas sp.]